MRCATTSTLRILQTAVTSSSTNSPQLATRTPWICRACSARTVRPLGPVSHLSPSRRPITTTATRSQEAATPQSQQQQQPTADPPPKPRTHYDLFPRTLAAGPPPHGPFSIPLRDLRTEFLQLQARAHPDVHPAGPPKRRAEAHSAAINDAYKTLSDPLLRAQYLLSLRGIDVAADEAAQETDAELLTAVLEAREAIEEAQAEEEVEVLRAENEARIEESVSGLEEAFGRDDAEAARREAGRLRYWMNIRQSLDEWERGKPVVLIH